MADTLEQNLMRIKQQDAFLRALMDTVPDGLRVLDEHKNVVLANRSLARQAGLPLTRIVGRPCYAQDPATALA